MPGLPEAGVRSIVARAEGIPLYAVETVRMLVADGRLRPREDGGYEPAGELGELAVPETLHALIAARLDALDTADRALVQDAAVLGQSFTRRRARRGRRVDRRPSSSRASRSSSGGDLIHARSTRGRRSAASTRSSRRSSARSPTPRSPTRPACAPPGGGAVLRGLGDDELAGALAAHYLAAYRASSEGGEAEALAGAGAARAPGGGQPAPSSSGRRCRP